MSDHPENEKKPVYSAIVDDVVEFEDEAILHPASVKTASKDTTAQTNVLPLRGIDHVRFFVGNARQSAYFYRNAFGFDVIAYAGLETKTRHEAGYVLRQGDITFVLASPLSPEHPDSYRIIQHGDGVQDIALAVDDVTAAYRIATERGAIGVTPPTLLEDEYGVYEYASIRAYGDTTHSFVNRDRYRGVFAPGYRPLDP